MEASKFLPEGEPQIPQIHVWAVHEVSEVSHHLFVDNKDEGIIDWETNKHGTIGYIDGLDAERQITERGMRDLAWLAIAACMHAIYPKIREIEHLDGTISLVEE